MAMRDWLESTGGKIAAGVLIIAGAVAIFFAVRGLFGPAPEVAAANERVFIDSATGKSFSHELRAGETIPVRAPSGNETGYPAELCYWTREGTVKEKPTAVLLNDWIGKTGPTFCPDCGRLVRPHNPPPMPDSKPPPTQAEHRPGRGEQQEER